MKHTCHVANGGSGYEIVARLLVKIGWRPGNNAEYMFFTSGDQVCIIVRTNASCNP